MANYRRIELSGSCPPDLSEKLSAYVDQSKDEWSEPRPENPVSILRTTFSIGGLPLWPAPGGSINVAGMVPGDFDSSDLLSEIRLIYQYFPGLRLRAIVGHRYESREVSFVVTIDPLGYSAHDKHPGDGWDDYEIRESDPALDSLGFLYRLRIEQERLVAVEKREAERRRKHNEEVEKFERFIRGGGLLSIPKEPEK